jgi:SLT domain-containing protein
MRPPWVTPRSNYRKSTIRALVNQIKQSLKINPLVATTHWAVARSKTQKESGEEIAIAVAHNLQADTHRKKNRKAQEAQTCPSVNLSA